MPRPSDVTNIGVLQDTDCLPIDRVGVDLARMTTVADIQSKIEAGAVATHSNRTALDLVSGTNTGDNSTNSQYSGLAASKEDALTSATADSLPLDTDELISLRSDTLRTTWANVKTFLSNKFINILGNAINLNAATGNEVAYTLDYTTNKATSGNDTGLLIKMTDTASPGLSYPFEIRTGIAGATTVTTINQNGSVVFSGNITTAGGGIIGFNTTNNLQLRPWNDTNLTGSTGRTAVQVYNGTQENQCTAGSHLGFVIKPVYNQASGTASNTDLLINRTEIALGSGVQRLLSAGTGGGTYVEKAFIDNLGSGGFKGLSLAITAISTNTTLTAAHSTILVSGNTTLTLPAASHIGRIYHIKKTDSAATTAVIDANASETIDGGLTLSLTVLNQVRTIQSDGTNWQIIGAYL